MTPSRIKRSAKGSPGYINDRVTEIVSENDCPTLFVRLLRIDESPEGDLWLLGMSGLSKALTLKVSDLFKGATSVFVTLTSVTDEGLRGEGLLNLVLTSGDLTGLSTSSSGDVERDLSGHVS